MKTFFILGILFSAHFAHATCEDLGAAGLYMGMQPGVYPVIAGQDAVLPVDLRVANPKAWQNLDSVQLEMSGVLNDTGSASMNAVIPLWTVDHQEALPSEIRMHTTKAMQGEYKLNVFYNSNGCGYPPANIPDIRFQVTNPSPQDVELDPPKINGVQVKSVYKLNQPMSFTIDVQDRSAICVTGTKNSECHDKATVWFAGTEGFIIVEADLKATAKSGRYEVSFHDGFFEAGDFPIDDIWIDDIWGNRSQQLALALHKKFNVK